MGCDGVKYKKWFCVNLMCFLTQKSDRKSKNDRRVTEFSY